MSLRAKRSNLYSYSAIPNVWSPQNKYKNGILWAWHWGYRMAKGKHKSVPKELKKHISWIEAQGAKVVLGLSECARHKFSPGHIRLVARDEAGLKAIGYSGNGVINFFIVCKSPELAEQILQKFGNNIREISD